MHIQYIILGHSIPIIHICILMQKKLPLRCFGSSARVKLFVLQSLTLAETRFFSSGEEVGSSPPPLVRNLLILLLYLENPGNYSLEKNTNFKKEWQRWQQLKNKNWTSLYECNKAHCVTPLFTELFLHWMREL